ncbi:hypothetical protein KMW28_11260 [Flammeovirga yaeyamensis]|uniref:Uncharacterized protein n=1 Tax=Flammeovirga yaeyamensis TaxID=367791 RepID=A0AAX1N269_9BACT|nr:hypothetical protein [Flammeovirga yaeyamensis]MBB3696264.1 uncharacterized protein YukE [Flammeovirga yaeyamensis]NMF34945.1 hypothetical protein [Flammeovirga yaeyamensis]QWG00230.1 hypothetical protein KMW28_11260 [Flammeovirga yaeyamensis]
MTISSMIQPEKKIHFFQIIEHTVYRFYALLKEGKGNIGDGKQCFKLKGRGVNLYSKREFLEQQDIEESFFDDLCYELWAISEKTPNWDIDRLFAYKNEITEHANYILEAKTLSDLELYISDSKTANFLYTFMLNFFNETLNVNNNIDIPLNQERKEAPISKDNHDDVNFQIEILNRFQMMEEKIHLLETENKRLDAIEKNYIDKIAHLESEFKRVEKLEETTEKIQLSRKKSLEEIADNTEKKFLGVLEKLNSLEEHTFNKDSVRDFIVKVENLNEQVSDMKSEYVKEDALQTFTKQLEKLNKEINHISDEYGNELKKIELRFTKIKGERVELRDRMDNIEESTKDKFDAFDDKLNTEVEAIHKVSDEMTHRQQELQSLLQDQIVGNREHTDKSIENIASLVDELKEKQHEIWIKINEVISKSKSTSAAVVEETVTTSQGNDFESAPTKSKYVDIFYAEPDGNGFLTNLSPKKTSYKHVYKINVIDEMNADFEFVNDEDSIRTLNMNLAVMFDEYMIDNGTYGKSMSLSLYGEAKKVRGLNAWRVNKKAMVTRR